MTARRRRQRGVTLVEVLIVVAIMALISAGVGFVVLKVHDRAQTKASLTRARALRSVAIVHVTESGTCPTVDDLLAEGSLETEGDTDAWGGRFGIACEGYNVVVTSSGRDKVPGNDDDLVVPAARGEEA